MEPNGYPTIDTIKPADPPGPPEVKEITDMSDREIAEETLYWLRQAGTALVQMQSGPMGRMMTNMFNKNK